MRLPGQWEDGVGFAQNYLREYSTAGYFYRQNPAYLIDGSNLYLYARAAPTKFMDPLGLASTGSVCTGTPKTAPSGSNCQKYALDRYRPKPDAPGENNVNDDGYREPTRLSGKFDCAKFLARLARTNGAPKLEPSTRNGICKDCGRKVFLAVFTEPNPKFDDEFHWWHEDEDGSWSWKIRRNDPVKGHPEDDVYPGPPGSGWIREDCGYFCVRS